MSISTSNPITSFVDSLRDWPGNSHPISRPWFGYRYGYGEEHYAGECDDGPIYNPTIYYLNIPNFRNEITKLCASHHADPQAEASVKRLRSLGSLLESVRESTEPFIAVFKKHIDSFLTLFNEESFKKLLSDCKADFHAKNDPLVVWLSQFTENFRSLIEPDTAVQLQQSNVDSKPSCLLREPRSESIFYGHSEHHMGCDHLTGMSFSSPTSSNQSRFKERLAELVKFDFNEFYRNIINSLSKPSSASKRELWKELGIVKEYFEYASNFIRDFRLIPSIKDQISQAIAAK